jgi:hypothetical protein
MVEFTLDGNELAVVNNIIGRIQQTPCDDLALYDRSRTEALRLPLRLREALTRLKLEMSAPCMLLNGFPVIDSAIGPTPANKEDRGNGVISREEVYLALIASHLGTPFAFATQQGGRLIQNILPMQESEYSQLGASSREELVWHTEDAFHSSRPDFILLMSLRNHDKVPTTVAGLPQEMTSADIENSLRANRLTCRRETTRMSAQRICGRTSLAGLRGCD